jgi:hypothetical protein
LIGNGIHQMYQGGTKQRMIINNQGLHRNFLNSVLLTL